MRDICAIIKPVGITSHDVVARVRKLTGIRKVGHAGTLDPLAEGVLVVGIGRDGTKKLGALVEKDKEYLAEIKLGFKSTTGDEEGGKMKCVGVKSPSEDMVRKVLSTFEGDIDQIPPNQSAIKIGGKPAYYWMRKGRKITLGARRVSIYSITLTAFIWPLLSIKVHCGSGVYIRSLAWDIGEQLQTGGYLTHLTRTRVGDYGIDKAIGWESLEIFFSENT